ncbi:MAG: multidrug ABC transporter ATP-binding protein [Ignavibacteriales bacterium CG_4_9_14_3_um_filter_34_10]|nr:MAG: multidrug ABC transporter ATP-binding protein [Ignavibacteriales bacterium CG_4_9_14_3_um_filter_34_10]
MNINAIEVKNLTKKFGDFVSVDNVSFNVKEGEIFGFLGANGAGKSTTLRMLCGILSPTSGDALVGGFSISNDPALVKKNIGYMSQRFSLYNDLTVEENINFFGGIYGLSGNKFLDRKKWVLAAANLLGREKTIASSLPGGIKQRLALGTAVIHRPGIVFLDEPTSGVDPISRRNFWNLINQLSEEGITIFVTTHYLEEAEYCNNIILIDSGKIVAEGTPKELKTKHIKNDIYEIETADAVKALELLEFQNYVDETSIFGNNIHVAFNENLESIDKVKQLFSDARLETTKMEKIIPTLEDVFIHLLDKDK